MMTPFENMVWAIIQAKGDMGSTLVWQAGSSVRIQSSKGNLEGCLHSVIWAIRHQILCNKQNFSVECECQWGKEKITRNFMSNLCSSVSHTARHVGLCKR